MVSQQAPGTLLPLPTQRGITGMSHLASSAFYPGAGDLNFSPHGFEKSTSLTQLLLHQNVSLFCKYKPATLPRVL